MPRTAVTPEVSLFHTDVGSGRPVVFVHGGHMTHEIWRHQTAAVAASQRVIAVDLRGHGASDKPYCEYTLDTFAEDLLTLIDRLDLKNVTLVGWSLGAQIVAKCLTEHPDVIDKAVFVSSILFDMIHPEVKAEIDVAELIEGQQSDQPGAMMKFVSSNLSDDVSEPTRQWVWNVSMQNPIYTNVNHLWSMGKIDYEEIATSLRKIDLPALVAYGTDDEVTSKKGANFFASDVLRGGRLVPFENSKHFPFISAAEQFNGTLLEFLQE